MRLINNYWFRWFAAGFLVGASIVTVAGVTDPIKDLKIESLSGRVVLTGPSAWCVAGTLLGLYGGVLGFCIGVIKKQLKQFNGSQAHQ